MKSHNQREKKEREVCMDMNHLLILAKSLTVKVDHAKRKKKRASIILGWLQDP